MRCFRLVSALAAVVAVSASAPIAAPVSVSAQSICARYTAATGLTERQLITAVVARAVLGSDLYNDDANQVARTVNIVNLTGIVSTPSLARYFDGSLPYDLNYNKVTNELLNHNFVASYVSTVGGPDFEGDGGTDGALFTQLADKLVALFGRAFGCSAANVGTVASTTMKAAHAGMNITAAIFNDFNTQVALSFESFGANQTDLATAGAYLGSFARNAGDNEICTDASCPLAPPPAAAAGSSSTAGPGPAAGGATGSSSTAAGPAAGGATGSSSTAGGPAAGGATGSSSTAGPVVTRGSSSTGATGGAATGAGAVVVPSMAVAAIALIASLAL